MEKKKFDILQYSKNMGTQRSSLMAVAQRVMDGSIADMEHLHSCLELVFNTIIAEDAWVDDGVESIVRPTAELFLKQQEALREAKKLVKDSE